MMGNPGEWTSDPKQPATEGDPVRDYAPVMPFMFGNDPLNEPETVYLAPNVPWSNQIGSIRCAIPSDE